MRAVLANGALIHMGGKTVKNVAGYDLGKAFIGSYGSLGIITEVTFRLLPLPQQQKTVRLEFDEMTSALDLTTQILDSELLPTSMNMLNSVASEWVLDKFAAPYTLIIDIDGSEETVTRQVAQVSAMADSAKVASIKVLDGEARSLFDD